MAQYFIESGFGTNIWKKVFVYNKVVYYLIFLSCVMSLLNYWPVEKVRHYSKNPNEMRYILIWTDKRTAPTKYFGTTQKNFLINNCSSTNCFVTRRRSFFGGDLTKFDAIAFNGRALRKGDLPRQRSPHQKYIYVNMESADNFPVCDQEFDNFFNWTATYRLDSDIYCGYILIRNSSGHVIGPKIEMNWGKEKKKYPPITEDFMEKTNAIAWFATSCETRSNRQEIVQELQNKLSVYNKQIHIYGKCGKLSCPRGNSTYCSNQLKRKYFFYLAFENSLVPDYVTEKVLTALESNVVPIVYGGANYSRFLPPGSYLDARRLTTTALAASINTIMSSPELYHLFFTWKGSYQYSDPTTKENVCALCAALNDKQKMETYSVYRSFRKWWLPLYEERCEAFNSVSYESLNYNYHDFDSD